MIKFLVDNALSPLLSTKLCESGYDSVHVRELNLQNSDDLIIFNNALEQNRVIISADTDFSTILSTWKYSFPSLILFRRGIARHPLKQIKILLENLSSIESALESGSIVVIEESRIRIRSLPL